MTARRCLPSLFAAACLCASLSATAADAPTTPATAATIVAAPAAAPAAPATAAAPATPAPQLAQAGRPSVSTRAPIRPAPVRQAPATRPETKPTWVELTPQQQASLVPLAGTWRTLSEAQKRKWIALSRNYPTMPPPEQERLHSRMTEWANLSPQQRTQARLNFAATKAVPAPDKKAKWEAYQALSPEEKRKLASRAATTKVPPAAAAVHPAPAQKQAHAAKPKRPGGARIAVIPGQFDQNTLLPRPGALPAKP